MKFAFAIAATAMCFYNVAQAQTAPEIASDVPELRIVALDSLPNAPAAASDVDGCRHLLVENVRTPAVQAVAAKGWGVTAEAPFGAWTAVSFVGGYVQATSGTCELLGGNVGLFQGDTLQVLIFGADDLTPKIGLIEALEDGALRIFNGDLIPYPVADLRLAGTAGMAIMPPARQDPVCNGTAQLPFIYGLPIDIARARLAEAGWQPVPTPPADTAFFGMASALAAEGIVEVTNCAGTGFGFCSFAYNGPAGQLSVTTAGEGREDGSLPSVVGYGVTCGTAP